MGYFGWLFLGLTLFSFHSTLADISSFVVPCDKDDVPCQTRVGQAAVPILTAGDPTLNMMNLDPAFAETIDLSNGGLKFFGYNMSIKGLSGIIFNKFHIDLASKKLSMKFEIPKLDFKGIYKCSGQILVLPITGNGNAEVKIKITPSFAEKALFDITHTIAIKEKDGEKYISLKDVNYKYDIVGNVHFMFENLFNGNKGLSDATHNVMNSEWKAVSAELSPPIGKLIIKVLTGNLKKLFQAIPLDKWIES